MSRRVIRRWLCWHKLRKVGESAFGNVYHCTRCNSILAEEFGPRAGALLYLGEYEDFFDKNSKYKFI